MPSFVAAMLSISTDGAVAQAAGLFIRIQHDHDLRTGVACEAALKGLRYGSRHARRQEDHTPGSAADTAHQVVVLY